VPHKLPPTSALLVSGGDQRIAVQPDSFCNQYGCQPFPAADRIAFASSTATQISAEAFAAADSLRNRIAEQWPQQSGSSIYKDELARLRAALFHACGLSGAQAPDLIFATSGTDAHLIASRLIAARAYDTQRAVRIIMVNPEESGSGVSAALNGRSFGSYTALGSIVSADCMDLDRLQHELVHVPIRNPDGSGREAAAIDADVDVWIESALRTGLDVLLVLIDVSKTGCVAPTPSFAHALRQRHPERIHVLVDACQFRIEAATLRAYLQQDFMVAVTGSKFIGGPSFSSALLIPQTIAATMRRRSVPAQLKSHSAQEEWPDGWQADSTLPSNVNIGLLLRWEAALCELAALQAVPAQRIRAFLQRFGDAVRSRLHADPHFEWLASPALPRRAAGLTPQWDDLQTIHAFTLYRPGSGAMSGAAGERQPMDRKEVADVYRRLQQTRHSDGCIYMVGQPVACGHSGGVEISALRVCAGARLIVQACADDGHAGADAAIAQAMACLDTVAGLIAAFAVV
jgi:hypothetical protein